MSKMRCHLWSIAAFYGVSESQREIERMRHLVAVQIATLSRPMPKTTISTANTFRASVLPTLPLSSTSVAKTQVAPIRFVGSPFRTIAPFPGDTLCAPETAAALEPLDTIAAPDIDAAPIDTDSVP